MNTADLRLAFDETCYLTSKIKLRDVVAFATFSFIV